MKPVTKRGVKMKKADVVVVGGSAAGPTAGISCRRRYPDKSVVLVRKEEKVLVPCGIPYIVGTIKSPDKNLIPDALLDKHGIELVKDEVVSIDRNQKSVCLESGEEIGYDRLILATGSLPFQLPIPGMDKENVFVVKKDVGYLNNMIKAMEQVKDIVIIGGGFIGVEFADECRKNRNCEDCKVSIIELLPTCLQLALDKEFCEEAESELRERNIQILTSKKVDAIVGNGKVSGVRLSSGEEIKADLVIVGVGAVPNVELAEKAGLKIGLTKAISVDRHMRTINDESIFACGDCAEKFSFFSGRLSRLMLASIATAEARIAGANLYGTCYSNPGAIGVFCTKVGERALGCAGLAEPTAKKEGFNVVIGEAIGPDKHPGSMPGTVNTKLKLIFCKEKGLLLGGSASGGATVPHFPVGWG